MRLGTVRNLNTVQFFILPIFFQKKKMTEKREYFDPPEKLTDNIKKLADLVRSAKHMVLFTGAGISTSAGNLSLK